MSTLQQVQQLFKEVNDLSHQRDQLQAKIEQIRKEIEEIQRKCPHTDYEQPSGSFRFFCKECGAAVNPDYLRKRRKRAREFLKTLTIPKEDN